MEADDSEACFWDFAPGLDDEIEKSLQQEKESLKNGDNNITHYNSRKPKWWIQQSQQRGTKSQRRALAAMKDYRLPRVSYGETIPWNQVFHDNEELEIWIEIGFGQGENLLANAERHAHVGMVGLEIHKPGLCNVLKRMHTSIQTKSYWSDYNKYTPDKDPFYNNTQPPNVKHPLGNKQHQDANHVVAAPAEKPYSNVRVENVDGMKLLPYLKSDSIARLLVTFPDPFPIPRDKEFRIIQVDTLHEFYRILQCPHGRFFLATDHEGYFDWCTSVFDQVNQEAQRAISRGEPFASRFRQVTPCPDRTSWLPVISKYEQKGWEEGRPTLVQCWEVWPPERE